MQVETAPETALHLPLLNFIERLPAFDTPEDLLDEMQRVLEPHGIEKIMVRTLPTSSLPDGLIAARWPLEFIKYYARHDCVRIDPIARRARGSATPFIWDASIVEQELDLRTRELLSLAASFGLAEGIVVPVHRPHGPAAHVSLTGTRTTFGAHDLPVVRGLALYVFDELWRRYDSVVRHPTITPREQEILGHAAEGRTAQEIADTLNIAKRTVDIHVSNACRKLKALTRTHAVALAIREGLIRL